RSASQIQVQVVLPSRLHRMRNFGIAIPRQIDETGTAVAEGEKIHELRSARCLGSPGQLPPAGEAVDGTGLAGVRSAGESNLAAKVGGALGGGLRACEKLDNLVIHIPTFSCSHCADIMNIMATFFRVCRVGSLSSSSQSYCGACRVNDK